MLQHLRVQLLSTLTPSGQADHGDLLHRREEEILRVYGADAQGGQAKERIKLQSELDRAQEQVQLAVICLRS